MKNFEKYKTAEERNHAYIEFCGKHSYFGSCESCPLKPADNELKFCSFKLLDLEVEEEKPMPCPFCNNEYVEVGKAVAGMRDVKCICGYRSPAKESEDEAIAAHNRVCKAVAAYKENN